MSTRKPTSHLTRILGLLEHFEPARTDGDTLWDGPFFIPRRRVWWPTSFLRYQDQLFCNVQMGWSLVRMVWDIGTDVARFEGTAPLAGSDANDEQLWLRVLDQVERRLRSAVASSAGYNARVARLLPLSSRTGKILRSFTWPPASPPPLLSTQIVRLERALSRSELVPGLRALTKAEYLRIAGIAYDAVFAELRPLRPDEKYRRKADGRHGGLLALPARSARAFRSWYEGRAWSGSHPWELVFAHPHGVLLSPELGPGGWRLHLWAGTPGLYVTVARMALALAKADVPFALSHAEDVLAALKGADRVEIGPFYGQLSLEELEQTNPGATRHVSWDPPPTLHLRAAPRSAGRRHEGPLSRDPARSARRGT